MKIWSQALKMAELTPAERNRYVDFLRAVSILVVIVGHWLIATAYYVDGDVSFGHLLKDQPQTQWLTWLFQVMPIFFIVGGYSNGVSLESAKRKGTGYAEWLAARLNRLVVPLLALVITWAAIALVLRVFGAGTATIQFASQAALIPTWFLAIYIIIVILAPTVYTLWKRFGFLSFSFFVVLAVLTDYAFFAADLRWLGFGNYLWVWLAIHQLGFAWRDKRLGGPVQLLIYSGIGLAALYLLTSKGPYPLAMVGSPDEGLSNTLPPKVTLLALGIFQFGLLLALEGPMNRALASVRLWAAAVLVNSMIMTVYLWHITVMVILVALLYLAGGIGLGAEPGSAAWWLWRPAWIGMLLILLVPLALPLSLFERGGRSTDTRCPSAARQIIGALLLCLGVALLAMFGYGGGPIPNLVIGSLQLDVGSFVLVIVGAAISGLRPRLG
ncbi:MAG: acyltransferase [Gammaproteobacteria bacterium]|nr:acyltransferase [Gammaproteobacteria bacterium]